MTRAHGTVLAGGRLSSGPRREGLSVRLARRARGLTLLHGWRRALLALLAGASIALAHAPFDFPFVLFVALPVLVLLLDGIAATERGWRGRLASPLWVGWCFGFGMHLAGLWWLGNALVVSGSAPAWSAPVASIALAALLALFPAASVLLARQLWTLGAARVLALGAAWGLGEMARATVLTGFPWNAIGTAVMPNALLMQPLAVVGVDAMNVLAVWATAAPALLLERRTRLAGVLLPVLLVGAQLGFGAWRLAGAELDVTGPSVRVVQPAVPQDEKWDEAERIAIFRRLLDLSAPEGEGERPDIVVWPETSLPFVLSDTPEALAVMGDVLADGQVLLAGGVRGEGLGEDRLWFNAVFAVDGSGRVVGSRDKVHLVPFGEYLPMKALLERTGLTRLVEAPGDFTAATRRETLTLPGGTVVLPLICYEAIFSHGLEAVGAPATVLLNITNDAWFGATPGPHQHMRQARLRSVESGLPMVRAANDGLSAVVDPYGRIIAGLARGERGAFDARLPQSVALPFQALRAMPLAWLLMGAAFAMVLGEAWRDRRRGS